MIDSSKWSVIERDLNASRKTVVNSMSEKGGFLEQARKLNSRCRHGGDGLDEKRAGRHIERRNQSAPIRCLRKKKIKPEDIIRSQRLHGTGLKNTQLAVDHQYRRLDQGNPAPCESVEGSATFPSFAETRSGNPSIRFLYHAISKGLDMASNPSMLEVYDEILLTCWKR
jgi:cobalamin-dependent methionine synthase I